MLGGKKAASKRSLCHDRVFAVHPGKLAAARSPSSEEEKPDGKGQYPNQDVVERLSLDHGDDPHSPDRRYISIDASEG
ncbi:hypothetical protein [Ensifer sp. 4252]|uniref:hypothetical protein n=1 Tax=Ensifer sp. 4252 TaxID=3373915 RepID=UPI003D1C5563